MSRKFDESEIVCDEEDEVTGIYFIIEGTFKFDFKLPDQPISSCKLIKYFRDDQFVSDYYVCHDKRSEFVYQKIKKIKAYALQE